MFSEMVLNIKPPKSLGSDMEPISLRQQHYRVEGAAPGPARAKGPSCSCLSPPLSTSSLVRLRVWPGRTVSQGAPPTPMPGRLGLSPWTLTAEQEEAGSGCGGPSSSPRWRAALAPGLSGEEPIGLSLQPVSHPISFQQTLFVLVCAQAHFCCFQAEGLTPIKSEQKASRRPGGPGSLPYCALPRNPRLKPPLLFQLLSV